MDELLESLSKKFEIVIFTASLGQYAYQLLSDYKNSISHMLCRDHCSMIENSYVKDLKRLGRDLHRVIIVDNSPICYSL